MTVKALTTIMLMSFTGMALAVPVIPTIPSDVLQAVKPQQSPLLARLQADCKAFMAAPAVSIVQDKKLVAPSGDIHDYISYGPYWWPDPKKPDGKPYIRRDGETYPEARKYDDVKLGKMVSRVYALSCLWYINKDKAAGEAAVEQLRVFYLAPETKMNPHLRYGQGIPGKCDGRVVGLIDTFQMVQVADAIVMLQDCPAMTAEISQGLKEWFGAYATWMHTDKESRKDYGLEQNHGLSYHTQIMAYAMLAGKMDIAKEHAALFGKLLTKAVAADGSLPRETIRTKGWSYSNYALFIAMQGIGCARNLGYDYLASGTETRAAICRAVDYLLSFHGKTDKWPYQQIAPFGFNSLAAIVAQLAVYTGEAKYVEALKLDGMSIKSRREGLFFGK